MSNSTEPQAHDFAVLNAELPTTEQEKKFLHLIPKKIAKKLGFKRYFTGKPCINNHVQLRYVTDSSCIECSKNRAKSGKAKRVEYQLKNKEILSEKQKKYRAENKHHIKSQEKRYYEKRKEPKAEARAKNRAKNGDAVRAKDRDYYRKNQSESIKRSRAWQGRNPLNVFTRRTISRIKSGHNKVKYEPILGYTRDDFVAHIESLWLNGMTWDNHNLHGWHIDHIKPISKFLKEGVTDVKIINSLNNLRPMWAIDNWTKGSKYDIQN